LLDVAAGYAGLYVPDGAPPVHAATLSLSVNFLARSNEGRVRAIGIRRNTGRSIYFSDAQLLSESGIVLASAQGVFKYRAANQ
jgi:acyl-coenzyme A thioesterase PaaI-like protein